MIAVVVAGPPCSRVLHACQPDAGERACHVFRVKALVLLSPKEFLNQVVVDHHPYKASCRQKRIAFAKSSLANAPADVNGQRFITICDHGIEKTR